ncbi:hypothetical protein [Candidatus Cardinium hertigii]|uniref:Uncharacterized protein n=1 Tax=Candidatus Cardinium hertigii TaxID=247481 RepID=A0A2Z3L8B2_9BACT|nr:hypothetical protein [Candidatus Cardinium hertigii]AWN81858.1 hypothetical protein DK880_00538 [Candidatus Cardinium hertigii]
MIRNIANNRIGLFLLYFFTLVPACKKHTITLSENSPPLVHKVPAQKAKQSHEDRLDKHKLPLEIAHPDQSEKENNNEKDNEKINCEQKKLPRATPSIGSEEVPQDPSKEKSKSETKVIQKKASNDLEDKLSQEQVHRYKKKVEKLYNKNYNTYASKITRLKLNVLDITEKQSPRKEKHNIKTETKEKVKILQDIQAQATLIQKDLKADLKEIEQEKEVKAQTQEIPKEINEMVKQMQELNRNIFNLLHGINNLL